jgi:pyruvate kinase
MALPSHKTRIVWTTGPSSDSAAILQKMIRGGVNVARLNFSRGDFTYHGELIDAIRRASAATRRRVAIMADLPGPKIRVGALAADAVELRAGERFTLTTAPIVGDGRRAPSGRFRSPAPGGAAGRQSIS